MDQSELAFRMLTRRHGAQLCYTPMFHSRLFAESEEYRHRMFEQHMQDRPLIVQVFDYLSRCHIPCSIRSIPYAHSTYMHPVLWQ